MLILTRHIGESIVIGDQVEVSVVDIKGDIRDDVGRLIYKSASATAARIGASRSNSNEILALLQYAKSSYQPYYVHFLKLKWAMKIISICLSKHQMAQV